MIDFLLDAENGDISAQIKWRSDRDGALGTGASIVVATLSPGTHVITAHVTDTAGVAADASITVDVAHPPVVNISAPADGSVYYVAQLPVTFVGQASDVEDGDLSSTIEWSSDLEGPLASLKNRNTKDRDAAVKLAELQRNDEAAQAMYNTFLQRYRETKQQEDIQQPDVRVVTVAAPPTVPSSCEGPAMHSKPAMP